MGTPSSSTGWQEQNEIANAFDGITPSSQSSSSSTIKKKTYDVFINHRGSDVKNTLASLVYHNLSNAGLVVFLDKNELDVTDYIATGIEGAIREASVHIAIFSRNYAQSTWCLAELAYMLETGTPIIPIFYHVQPYDVRWVTEGKGIYADAFVRLEKKGRYSPEKVYEWKKALHQASYLSGFVLDDSMDMGTLMENIQNTVLKLIKKVPVKDAKHLVGLDEAAEDFEKSTSKSSERHQNVEIVGIVGMGGCGKTTLAKELYDRKMSSYDGSSFISEVQKISKNHLYNLQKKLLDDLVGDVKDLTFDNVDHGKEILEYHLRSLRVLIVLDDIDYPYQLDALMAAKDSLGPGSFIIVTTRDMGILKRFGISSIYKMKGLNRHHAEHLFCWHAFLQSSPLPGFEDLVEKFLKACNGLPLTLKVLGGLLDGKSKDYWEIQSHKIARLLPEDVKNRLKLSYEALDEETKEIFLDISCFFIGENMSSAVLIWEQSGWNGQGSLETLVDKSLVEIDHQNRIRMHSQLRDLGRQIAFQKFPSRFSSQGQSTVCIDKPAELYRKSKDHPEHEFDKISGIMIKDQKQIPKVLVVIGDSLKGEWSNVTRGLLWLRWYDCPHFSIPPGISLENLRVLDLRNGFFNKLWLHNVKLPKFLSELHISGSIAEFPKSIGQLQHLETISIKGWPNTSLKALPQEFCNLQSLKHLSLRWCRALASLPENFGNLTNLQHLALSFCDRLKELPHSFEQLMQLNYLDFQGCEKLMVSSHFLGKITGLERLNLKDCRKLKVLPVQVPCQLYLRSLNLVGTNLQRLPYEVGKLVNLEVLEIGSPYLTDLPISLGNLTNLRTLNVDCCKRLTSLPDSLGLLRDASINVPEALKEALNNIVEENIDPDKKN